MIIEYIRYTIDAARSDAFIAAYGEAAVPLLESPHCLHYELARCEEEPAAFIVRLHWTSTPDHLERFRGSDHFKAFFTKIRAFVDDIDEMRHYAVLDSREG